MLLSPTVPTFLAQNFPLTSFHPLNQSNVHVDPLLYVGQYADDSEFSLYVVCVVDPSLQEPPYFSYSPESLLYALANELMRKLSIVPRALLHGTWQTVSVGGELARVFTLKRFCPQMFPMLLLLTTDMLTV